MSRSCINCAAPINTLRADAKFCSARCRVSHGRSKALPRELTTRDRWVRHDARKRPLVASTGRLASSTDSSTWVSYAEARKSAYGVGLGFALTADDDIACIDIDDCVTDGVVSPAALEVARATPGVFWVELSPSGEGLHVWHHCEAGPGTNRVENGIRVERYSQGRYITVTGRKLTI